MENFRIEKENMKRTLSIAGIIFLLATLSVGIINSITTLTGDINRHAWASFIGRWQCYEKAYFEIEFNPDQTFTEYYYERNEGTGVVRSDGGDFVMIYDAASCTSGDVKECTININFSLDKSSLVLVIHNSRLTFYRVDEQ
jgi:hypothetical protein